MKKEAKEKKDTKKKVKNGITFYKVFLANGKETWVTIPN
jgi:hypothetical protein